MSKAKKGNVFLWPVNKVVCMCPSDETLNRGPMFREMSRLVHVKDPSSRFR